MKFVDKWLITPIVGFWSRTYRGVAPRFQGLARAPPLLNGERGAVNLSGIILLAIAMIFIAVGFIFLPISTSATTDLLNYACTTNTAINSSLYTGFTSIVGITPLLILVGFVTGGIIVGIMGVKVMKAGGGAQADLSTLVMLGLTIVFISIGLIVEPITLDGICTVLHGSGHGVSASFVGYESILLISPLLVHLGFIVAAVISGFFGIKRLQSSEY